MNQARLALDYIDVLIWPLVVAGVVTLLVLRFRVEIAALIGRIRSASGPLGIAFQMGEQQTAEAEEGPAVVAFLSGLLAHKENEITQRIVEATKLTQQLALYQIYYFFERTYRVIFGTQIALLQRLSLATNGADLSEIIPLYEDNVRLMRLALPTYDYPLASYLGFLQASELITVHEGRHYITEPGRTFLQWMNAERLSPWKPN
jgi:hypothetical protein